MNLCGIYSDVWSDVSSQGPVGSAGPPGFPGGPGPKVSVEAPLVAFLLLYINFPKRLMCQLTKGDRPH